MSSFICVSSGTCWQECEETGDGYATRDGAVYSITLEGLSVSSIAI